MPATTTTHYYDYTTCAPRRVHPENDEQSNCLRLNGKYPINNTHTYIH